MDAVKFLVECHNYCEDCRAKTGDKWTTEKCFMCELNYHINVFKQEGAERMVELLERLVEEKKKTRQSEFLKLYPSARIFENRLNVCPLDLDKTFDCYKYWSIDKSCNGCKHHYWGERIEEDG